MKSPLGILTIFLCLIAGTAWAQFGGIDLGNVVKGAKGAVKLTRGAAGFSLQDELNLGGSLATEIAAKKGGILKDEALTRRVATIGKALSLYSTRPDISFVFTILDNPEINAWSCPGGYVFVTKGLVASCQDDRQLAAVLAHEMSHVTRRHALKLIARNESLKGLSEIASAAGGGNVSGFDDAISKAITSLLEKGFDPAIEFDADCHGAQLLADAGFPPKALRDYLAQLAKDQQSKPFSSHPPIQHRIERLDEFLEKNG
ncbi:MAG: M48 family metalloprotease [Verrucomicrobiae bacterium]|nr:M48 family metalloprotease [Verrucomicrobiae bacterium]